MDPAIKQTIDGYTAVFGTLPVQDDAVKKEIEAFKKEFDALGEGSSDIMDFMNKMQSGGILAKYSALVTRASAPPPPGSKEGAPAGPKKLPTVREFLEQYRIPYENAKAAGYRKRAEKAYENIFAVADRTDDLLEMNIILEQERLLYKIVSEELLDIYQPLLDAADPLNTALVEQFKSLLKVCAESTGDEELTYRTEIAAQENQQRTFRFMTRMTAAITFSGLIMGYEMTKRNFQYWLQPESDLKALLAIRDSLRRAEKFFSETWDWGFDSMTEDEWMRAWMLVPVNLDCYGRIRKTLDPHNFAAMREILFAEALSDKPMEEILLHEQEEVYWFDLLERGDEVTAKYTELAKQRNSHLTYFQYQERIQAAAGEKKIALPEEKKRTGKT